MATNWAKFLRGIPDAAMEVGDEVIEAAPMLADEAAEIGDDIFKNSPMMKKMNDDLVADAARKARQADLDMTLANPVENLPYKNLANKSAEDSAKILNNPQSLVLDEVEGYGQGLTSKELIDNADLAARNQDFLDYGAPNSSKVPALRPETPMVSQAIPEVLPPEASMLPATIPPRGAAPDIIIPKADRGVSALNKILLGGAAVGGGALTVNSMMGGGNGGGPQDPAQAAIQNAVNNPPPVSPVLPPEVIPPQAKMPAGQPQAAPVAPPAPIAQTPLPPVEEPLVLPEDQGFTENTVDGLQAAQQQAAQGRLANELGRASELIGSSIAGTKPIAQDIFTQQAKASGQVVEDFEKRAEKEKSDPKSAISKQFRDFVAKFGVTVPSNMSAEAAAKVMPYAYQKFAAKEAQVARKEESAESREFKQKEIDLRREELKAGRLVKTETKLNDAQNAFAQKIAPKIQNKQFDKFNTLNQARQSIADSVASPNPQEDSAIIYNFIKTLDPESAVREGEITFVGSARGIPARTQGFINKMYKGELLTPQERSNILDFATKAAAGQKKAWEVSAAPYINQANKMGVPVSFIVPELEEMIQVPSEKAPSGKAPVIEKGKDSRDIPAKDDNKAPGRIVKESKRFEEPSKSVVKKGYNPKTNQTQFIYSDGTKEIVEGKK